MHFTPHKFIGTLALSLSCAITATSLGAESVVLDPVRTTIDFTLGDVLHTVHGTFKLKSGVLHFDPDIGKASGSIVVDATSGNSGGGERDKRMNKNILESERYPEIVFTPDSMSGKVVAQGTSQVQVHGLFRIHGSDHEIALPFEVQNTSGQVTAATRFLVPYVEWGMKDPSTFLLRVNKTVEIRIRATGKLSDSTP